MDKKIKSACAKPISAKPTSAKPISAQPTTDRKMLEMLVCPLTGGSLRYDATAQELISVRARLAYKIRDGVPIMIAVEARALDEDEI